MEYNPQLALQKQSCGLYCATLNRQVLCRTDSTGSAHEFAGEGIAAIAADAHGDVVGFAGAMV